MRKPDLKNGMVVELKNGEKYLVVDNMLAGDRGFISLATYNDDLTHKFTANEDIFKVYNKIKTPEESWDDTFLAVLWEREWKLESGDVLYTINFKIDNSIQKLVYRNDEIDEILSNKGLVFRTKEEAIECAKKMLSVVE